MKFLLNEIKERYGTPYEIFLSHMLDVLPSNRPFFKFLEVQLSMLHEALLLKKESSNKQEEFHLKMPIYKEYNDNVLLTYEEINENNENNLCEHLNENENVFN